MKSEIALAGALKLKVDDHKKRANLTEVISLW